VPVMVMHRVRKYSYIAPLNVLSQGHFTADCQLVSLSVRRRAPSGTEDQIFVSRLLRRL